MARARPSLHCLLLPSRLSSYKQSKKPRPNLLRSWWCCCLSLLALLLLSLGGAAAAAEDDNGGLNATTTTTTTAATTTLLAGASTTSAADNPDTTNNNTQSLATSTAAAAAATATTPPTPPRSASDFSRLGLPFSLFRDAPARLTGVAVVARRSGARPALVFAGGRHALSGQGWLLFQDAGSSPAPPSFSTPAVPFAPLGGYNAVAALAPPTTTTTTTTTPPTHIFLLAGGVCQACSSANNCYNGGPGCRNTRTPARLFAVEGVDDGGGGAPSSPPRITEVWKEPTATSNRAGALARMAGDRASAPTVIVGGEGGLDIWRDGVRAASTGGATSTAAPPNYQKAYHLGVPRPSDSASRYVGVDARVYSRGSDAPTSSSSSSLVVALGGRGAGPSASVLSFPPVPDSSISLSSSPQNLLLQTGSTDFETAGVIVGDLLAPVGDGNDGGGTSLSSTATTTTTRVHVVVANGAGGAQQPYIYTLMRDPTTNKLTGPVTVALGTKRINGRSVATGRFFGSGLPDIAIATTTGTIELYANESSQQDGVLKFTYRGALQARTRSDGFEIRGLASFRNPGASFDALVAAAYNPGRSKSRSAACTKVSAPVVAERADQVLASWPCHNAFVFYVKE